MGKNVRFEVNHYCSAGLIHMLLGEEFLPSIKFRLEQLFLLVFAEAEIELVEHLKILSLKFM